MKKLIFIIFAILLLQSCKSFYNTDNESIYQTYWVLPEKGKADKYFFLNQKNGQAQGFIGCNIFKADFKVKTRRRHISFTNITTTKRVCASKTRRKIEENMLKILNTSYKYQIDGATTLIVKDKKGNVLEVFKGYANKSFREE